MKFNFSERVSDFSSGRDNHFNLIRVVAAFAVLVSHSYPLSLGASAVAPLSEVLGISLGRLAVLVFFCASGFFIAQSFYRRSSLIEFVWARFLRIFPGLLMVLVGAVLVVGPLATTLPLSDYLSHEKTISYVSQNLKLKDMQWGMPGVFAGVPFAGSVNGSLWTLYYEVACYFFLAAVGVLGFCKSALRFGVFLAIYFSVYLVNKFFPEAIRGLSSVTWKTFFSLSFPFVLGWMIFHFRQMVVLSPAILVGLVSLAWIGAGTPAQLELLVIAVVYSTIYLGFKLPGVLLQYNKLGDYSYGVYIIAFPVQQLIANFQHGISPLSMMVQSALLTIPLAICSWHLVEEPALRLKSKGAAIAAGMQRVLFTNPAKV